MNLILFEQEEVAAGLPESDPKVVHVLDILGFGIGDEFDAGIVDGPIGKARFEKIPDSDRMAVSFEAREAPDSLFPLITITGVPRPQAARRLLRELTSLGVGQLWFVSTDRGEPGYIASRLWTTREYRRHLKIGAAQAFCTRLPEVRLFENLSLVFEEMPRNVDRVGLDNYEATSSLSRWRPENETTILALGAERGWSGAERDLLRSSGFELYSMGQRVLRVETASVAAVSLVLAARHLL